MGLCFPLVVTDNPAQPGCDMPVGGLFKCDPLEGRAVLRCGGER